jgi:hypothetical protein
MPRRGNCSKLAKHLVDAHREPEILEPDAGRYHPGLHAMPVDAIIRDDDWRALDFERRQGMSFDDEFSDDHYRKEARIRQFIGRVTWPRSGMD